MTFDKLILSGSTDGMAILISASASEGNTVHTAGTSAQYDEVWVYAQNNHTADVVLTLQFGDASAQNNIIKTITTKAGLVCLVPGLILTNGKILKAFAATPNVISINGFVNRITQ